MTPEYARVVNVAQPAWFLRENVRHAPDLDVPGYSIQTFVLNNRWLGEAQDRTRKFWFGSRDGRRIFVETVALESVEYRQAVTSSLRAVSVKLGGNGRPKRTYSIEGKRHGPDRGRRAALAEMLEHQGLPVDYFDDVPLTQTGKRIALGNGVPMAMGRAVARAVKQAVGAR
jgi:DNA (cytosine-5)-methyltransferase 1